jgi:hypothetical protein
MKIDRILRLRVLGTLFFFCSCTPTRCGEMTKHNRLLSLLPHFVFILLRSQQARERDR